MACKTQHVPLGSITDDALHKVRADYADVTIDAWIIACGLDLHVYEGHPSLMAAHMADAERRLPQERVDYLCTELGLATRDELYDYVAARFEQWRTYLPKHTQLLRHVVHSDNGAPEWTLVIAPKKEHPSS